LQRIKFFHYLQDFIYRSEIFKRLTVHRQKNFKLLSQPRHTNPKNKSWVADLLLPSREIHNATYSQAQDQETISESQGGQESDR
jgi:hypothetical protein